MEYTMTRPCSECPFLLKFKHGFTLRRLNQFASREFPCHQTAVTDEEDESEGSDFLIGPKSVQCAGALIFLEKRRRANQMMRICMRLRLYDPRKLDMKAPVR